MKVSVKGTGVDRGVIKGVDSAARARDGFRKGAPYDVDRQDGPKPQVTNQTSTASIAAQGPPVIILGGSENALSMLRSFARRGIVVDLSTEADGLPYFSKYGDRSYAYRGAADAKGHWQRLLLGESSHVHHGRVLLAGSDRAVEFLAENYDALKAHYILDACKPELQLKMLDKRETLRLAQEAGCVVPKSYAVREMADVQPLPLDFAFPVIIKPIYSHLFMQATGKKYFEATNQEQLEANVRIALDRKLDIMISEFVPGGDDLLSSYYTYIDENGKSLFDFTKRVIRRFPANQGGGTHHVTDWLPETADEGKKFFRSIGYRGLGNIEFKRDPRDGQLKVIECNPRFTAAQELLVRSGMDTAWFVYCHLTGRPTPAMDSYRQNVHYWYPFRDFSAFRELQGMGQLTFWSWLKSLRARPVFPYFSLSDPLPGMVGIYRWLSGTIRHRLPV